MEVSKISNQNFNGWKHGATDILCFYMSGNWIYPAGIKAAIQNIEKNATNHIVDFDSSYGFPVLRAIEKNTEVATRQILVSPGIIFNRTLRSCLNKMNRILKKENLKFTNTNKTVIPPEGILVEGAPPIMTNIEKYRVHLN